MTSIDPEHVDALLDAQRGLSDLRAALEDAVEQLSRDRWEAHHRWWWSREQALDATAPGAVYLASLARGSDELVRGLCLLAGVCAGSDAYADLVAWESASERCYGDVERLVRVMRQALTCAHA